MTGRSELRINQSNHLGAPRIFRHTLVAFLRALEIDGGVCDDIQTAVGEALGNAVEHAYSNAHSGDVELRAQVSEDLRTIAVDVFDHGSFIEREPREGRGRGLIVMRAIAKNLSLNVADGTHVHMLFDVQPSSES